MRGVIRLSSVAHAAVATWTRITPSGVTYCGRGDRGDLRSHQLRPLLEDRRLLQPLLEAATAEVARERVGQWDGRARAPFTSVDLSGVQRQTGSARSGRQLVHPRRREEHLRAGRPRSRRANRRWRSRVELREDIVQQQRRLGAAGWPEAAAPSA